MALAESGLGNIELLFIDDGGSVDTATERANALTNQERVLITIGLGFNVSASESQQAFSDLPLLIAGYWLNTSCKRKCVYLYS